MRSAKIHGICMVKNEADIIEQNLKSSIKWCDHIYVFDNGSTDGTWNIVKQLAKKHTQIIPYIQKKCLFTAGLRREVFNKYKHKAKQGDWWCCRLDADEFYVDDPKVFLAKIPEKYNTVWGSNFNYHFTTKDLEKYEENNDNYSDSKPVEEKCRYYANTWSELRFFRHSEKLTWDNSKNWPSLEYHVYPVRIWLKHYQFRSPQQMQKRLEDRKESVIKNKSFIHLKNHIKIDDKNNLLSDSWKSFIAHYAWLHYDNHDGKLIPRANVGTELPATIKENPFL